MEDSSESLIITGDIFTEEIQRNARSPTGASIPTGLKLSSDGLKCGATQQDNYKKNCLLFTP
jgi:hypothetical protein